MANLPKCRRCGRDNPTPTAHTTNRAFCSVDCRDTWWNEYRDEQVTQEEAAARRLGSPAPSLKLSAVQASWLAALIDGEGSIGIWRMNRRENRSGLRYRASVQVSNTNRDIIDQARALVGGYAVVDACAWRKNPKHRVLYRVNVRARAIRSLLECIRPYLIIKQRQADVVIEFCRVMAGSPMQASCDHPMYDELYQKTKLLNKRGAL